MGTIEKRLRQLETPVENIEMEEEGTALDYRDINALKSQAELQALVIENKLRAEELENRRQDRRERKIYARISFGFLSLYMLLVFSILIFNGLELYGFHFDNSALIALITTTTANVIGIFAFVMKYLFSRQEGHKQANKQ